MNVLHNYLVVGAILFVFGAVGFLTRRNLIVMFLSAEMMLQGVSLNLIAFGRHHGNYSGQSFTVFVLTIAACEAGLAMALIIALYQRKKTLDVAVWHSLGEPDVEPLEEEPVDLVSPGDEASYPRLTPAGHEPELVDRKVTLHV